MRAVEVHTQTLAGACADLRAGSIRLPDQVGRLHPAATGDGKLDEAVRELTETLRRNARGLAYDLDAVATALEQAGIGYQAVESAAAS